MSESNIINIPNEIKLDKYIYTYKCKLKEDYYSFRCKYRTKCSILIKINLKEIKKYLNKESNIIYNITSTMKEHSCQPEIVKEKESSNENEINTNDLFSNKEFAEKLIFANLDKPFSFHKTNLEYNNIKLTANQIKWIIQKFREKIYPNDDKYLHDISKILISYDNNIKEVHNIPLCHKYVNIINPIKNFKLEKYVIFTTKFQMNMLFKCSQLLIDGTFKSCQRTFLQIIHIAGFYPDINGIIPIFIIPTTSKSEFIYKNIFDDIKKLLMEHGFNVRDIPKRIMLDFEKGLINAVKEKFSNSIIDGCFFHFSKLLWSKAKYLGMCNKKEIIKTKLLMFILKLIPFMKPDNREEFFRNLEQYFSNSEEKHKKMVLYFKKNWLNNPYINYYDLSQEEFLNRTNNYLESFHHILNDTLDCYHPKLSFLIDKYKIYLKNIYEKIKNSLIVKSEKKEEKFSVVDDKN